MGDWLDANPTATEVDWRLFGAWFIMTKASKLDPATVASVKATLSAAAIEVVDPALHGVVMQSLVAREYAAKAAEPLLRVADGGDPAVMADARDTLTHYFTHELGHAAGASLEDSIVSSDITAILKKRSEPGYKWRLGCLQDALGDLRKGDFLVVATRPDTGKTTLLASESTFIASQMKPDQHVLWINNEEAGEKVMRRIVQSATGHSNAELERDPARSTIAYHKAVGKEDRFVVYDKPYISTQEVEALCVKYTPGLIIFDQLHKIKGFNKEANSEVERQTLLFQWGRELAKSYAPVITVHQADGSAEGVKWISMAQLYGSKTGIQGEADAIITIGRLPEEGNTRYLYVPKNKMDGEVPELRNGKFEIEIQPAIGRFKEAT